MLSRGELREIADIKGQQGYFVSLYLNVDPMFNKKADYEIHLKNMISNAAGSLDKTVHKAAEDDLKKVNEYALGIRKSFKKGLVLLSSSANSFWREYNLGVPVKNELVVDKTPHIVPLAAILDNYERYAVLLVEKDFARIFVVFLGEIVEYGEVSTADFPGKHKKGGWFALSQDHYARHVDHHQNLHLKDVIEKLDSFLSEEYIGKLIIGGSDEAVSAVKHMLHHTVKDKIIGDVRVELFAKTDEVQKRVDQVVSSHEKKVEDETVDRLIAKAMKNENAVIGLDNVIQALQEQRVMKLMVLKGYDAPGYNCPSCGFLNVQKADSCPYCRNEIKRVDHMVDLAAGKAIQQSSLFKVVEESKKLKEAGGIGAFLRF